MVGGSGFVGSSIAAHLANQFDVVILDRVPPKGFTGQFRECDIREKASLINSLEGFELVVNTAIIQVPEINEKRRLGYEVNVIGTQNICEAVESVKSIKGLLHAGSWHVFGESGLRGTVSEEFGFRPDKIEDRARFYAFCKIAQEAIIRITSTMSTKSYGIIRLGTVLGHGMPKLTAANLFIEKALKGEPMTPFKHTQFRPMLYVDVQDVCLAFEHMATRIINGRQEAANVVNLVWPTPMTIIDLARIVQKELLKITHGQIKARIQVIDKRVKPTYSPTDKKRFTVDVSRALDLIGSKGLTSPQQSIERILRQRLSSTGRERSDYVPRYPESV
jgi:nucleoside-diphosphate-sugar epimerase